jgi:FRG domain
VVDDDDEWFRSRTETVRMESWEQFRSYIEGFEDDPSRKIWDEVWFRGQGNAKWKLQTTLERRTPKVDVVSSYLNLISEIKPAIETFTGNTFDFPEREVEKMCREYDCFEFWLRRSTTYLAHLRHCGFPSPLLDWSKSPYVAAYFAFARAKHDGNVAIYAYRERANSAGFQGEWERHTADCQLRAYCENSQATLQAAVALYDLRKVARCQMVFRATRERIRSEG